VSSSYIIHGGELRAAADDSAVFMGLPRVGRVVARRPIQ
jgi:hypothetical protein